MTVTGGKWVRVSYLYTVYGMKMHESMRAYLEEQEQT